MSVQSASIAIHIQSPGAIAGLASGLDMAPWGKPFAASMDRGLLIGEVAARTGVSRKALRLYEARGILPPALRTASGYRRYPADVRRS